MNTNSTENTAVREQTTPGYDLVDSLVHNEKLQEISMKMIGLQLDKYTIYNTLSSFYDSYMGNFIAEFSLDSLYGTTILRLLDKDYRDIAEKMMSGSIIRPVYETDKEVIGNIFKIVNEAISDVFIRRFDRIFKRFDIKLSTDNRPAAIVKLLDILNKNQIKNGIFNDTVFIGKYKSETNGLEIKMYQHVERLEIYHDMLVTSFPDIVSDISLLFSYFGELKGVTVRNTYGVNNKSFSPDYISKKTIDLYKHMSKSYTCLLRKSDVDEIINLVGKASKVSSHNLIVKTCLKLDNYFRGTADVIGYFDNSTYMTTYFVFVYAENGECVEIIPYTFPAIGNINKEEN